MIASVRRLLLDIPLFALCVWLTIWPLEKIRAMHPKGVDDSTQMKEVLYLPSGIGLELMSFGYGNVLADLLWFNTINYFGKHYQDDQNYRWLHHMCDLVTTLDPRAFHVYEFGSTMLGWEMGAPDDAIKLLDKALLIFPDSWRIYYLRGFIYMFFKKDAARAQADFVKASKLPGVHYIVARLAAKSFTSQDDPETAISFLSEMIETTIEPSARQALEHRLREAIYERDHRMIERAVGIFKERHGRFPADIGELVSGGIMTKLPKDPFGGQYYLDGASAEAKSTTGRKRLKLYASKKPAEGEAAQ